MKNGVGLIAIERQRQRFVENWTASHDDNHRQDELACVAALYALPSRFRHLRRFVGAFTFELDLRSALWPPTWAERWWKPAKDMQPYWHPNRPTDADRIRELVKAGALIAAEIDRLQRRMYVQKASSKAEG